MWVLMGAAKREEFLADVHVGVLSAAVGKTGRTLAVPAWYSYQLGGLLTVLTGRRSRKAAAIRAAGRFGLCVQDDKAALSPGHLASCGVPGTCAGTSTVPVTDWSARPWTIPMTPNWLIWAGGRRRCVSR